MEAIAHNWRERGGFETLADLSCFVVDEGGGADDRSAAVLWLHGFPSSSLDWRAVIDRMPPGRRHLLMDFPGFGFSDKPSGSDYSYSLVEQADRVLLMLQRRGIERIHLVAHDMGTSVACEMLARRAMGLLPVQIESLALTNGSVYIEQARLTPSQKLLRSPLAGLYARIARWSTFRWQIGRILHGEVAEEELRAMWQLMRYNDGLRTLPATIRYVDERYRFYRRWTDPLAVLDVPTKVIWGRHDPVAVEAIGQRLAETIPGAQVAWLEECGHFPMLEAPEPFARALVDFIGNTGA
ncbi:MAG: alpha/beta fold hydrolase [Gammaproteobacteria bacterium]|jgi:pimeloyl-ACP methyl ester carboxylesterase|nr:alpha/beta fold hydrolase [Gammaproteobacteria bacterium]